MPRSSTCCIAVRKHLSMTPCDAGIDAEARVAAVVKAVASGAAGGAGDVSTPIRMEPQETAAAAGASDSGDSAPAAVQLAARSASPPADAAAAAPQADTPANEVDAASVPEGRKKRWRQQVGNETVAAAAPALPADEDADADRQHKRKKKKRKHVSGEALGVTDVLAQGEAQPNSGAGHTAMAGAGVGADAGQAAHDAWGPEAGDGSKPAKKARQAKGKKRDSKRA